MLTNKTASTPTRPALSNYPSRPTVRPALTPNTLKPPSVGVRTYPKLPSSVELSPTGDMIVELRSEDKEPVTTTCTVDSRILQLTSPVFRALLGGGFKEGVDLSRACEQNRELYKLELHDDNANAMFTILNILHHNTGKVRKSVSLPELVEIAVISEKYFISQPLYPWIEMWHSSVKHLALNFGNEDYLLVAWAFKDK
ncbi:hypothetical protein K440DRAFT_78634 [Wilcoxina mikolae CBS 423.85]|nr:hypothetical protein K440DRAFT_78634 [Wilcoxina mikolae CBS 423.85]